MRRSQVISAVILASIMLTTAALVYLWQEPAAIIVTVDSQGRIFLDDDEVSLSLFEDRLREVVERGGIHVAYFNVDKEVEYKEIIAMTQMIRNAGVDGVGMLYVNSEH